MRKLTLSTLIVCTTIMGAPSLLADIVTFNETVLVEGGQATWASLGITFYDEAGYRFTADDPGQTFFLDNDIHSDSANVDDDYLFNQNSAVAFTITRVDGQAFSFKSFLAGGVFGGNGTLGVVGNLEAGGQVNQNFDYVPGGETGNAFQLYTLSSDFNDPLTSVVVTRTTGNFAGYDDFSLNIIPAPGVLGVLAIGIVGIRRRRRN